MRKQSLLTTVLTCAVCIGIHAFVATPVDAYSSTSCPAANPYDSSPDSAAIQDCVDNYDVIELDHEGGAGYVGYIIDDSIRIRDYGRGHGPVVIASGGGDYGKAVLIADASLYGPILDVDGDANDYEFHQLRLDGNRYNRSVTCGEDYRWYGSNALLKGSSFAVIGVESVRALCGSAMEVAGSDFEISSSTFYDNGTAASAAGSGQWPWSDGITLLRCDSGYVHNNSLSENTDVDIVLFNGTDCWIGHNTISHTSKEAFAGINIGAEDGSSGFQVWDNDIYADEDLLGGGIVLGSHAWDPNTAAYDIGEIYENSVYGAVVNLVVDGIADGYVHDNSLSSARGSTGLFGGCGAQEYTAGHFGSATLDSGYASLVYDGGSCQAP